MLLRSRGVPVGDRLRAHGVLTARPRRARSGHGARAASKARSRRPLYILSLKQLDVI